MKKHLLARYDEVVDSFFGLGVLRELGNSNTDCQEINKTEKNVCCLERCQKIIRNNRLNIFQIRVLLAIPATADAVSAGMATLAGEKST